MRNHEYTGATCQLNRFMLCSKQLTGSRTYYCWGIITFRADSAKLVYAALAPSAITSFAR